MFVAVYMIHSFISAHYLIERLANIQSYGPKPDPHVFLFSKPFVFNDITDKFASMYYMRAMRRVRKYGRDLQHEGGGDSE